MKLVYTMVALLFLIVAGAASGSSDRAVARVSITKLAVTALPLPELVVDPDTLDLSSVHAWARVAGARIDSYRVPSSAEGLATELIIVTFE